ncbi:MAG: NAD(P)-binding protein [Ilumatobacteraceae bacterium]
MTSRRRIAIVGGGPAGLSAALTLTDPTIHPNWQDEYEVTVIQMGWRLGGKGATGRSGTPTLVNDEWSITGPARVEEHGIHLFGNMYVNSLRTLDGCLGELQRAQGEPRQTVQNDLIPSNYIQLADYFDNRWHLTPQHLPHNDMQPWGEADYPPPLVLIREMLRLAVELLEEALGYSGDGNAHHRGLIERLRILRELRELHHLQPHDPDPTVHGLAVHELWGAAHIVSEMLRESPEEHKALLRSVYCQLELYATVARGVIDDQIFTKGIDSVDGENFMDWCRRHGMSEVAVNSSPVQMPAEMCFQFPHGDTACDPQFSAAGFLWFTLRQILACGQATYWFHRGTGDTVIAPFYRVAAQRGVQFKFFRRVEHIGLSDDGASVATIELGVQATTVGEQEYQPLVRLEDGTYAWPNKPIYGQLVQGEQLKAEHVDLESWWSPWRPVAHETLRVGEDFDEIVLAVPLPCLPHLAPELVEAAPWKASVHGLGGLATLSSQIWTNRTSEELGMPVLTGTDRVVGGAAVPPLGFSDMTDVLEVEQWEQFGDDAPQGLYYFCGPLQHEGPWPPFTDHETPHREKAQAKATVVQWLRTATTIMPGAGTMAATPQSFDFAALWCPPESSAQGEARFTAQYWRANIDPNERYVPSPPGSVVYRPKAWESGFTNVALASDWIFTGINIGSFEGAVMSGMLASYALTGAPLPSEISGYDFGRPG